MSNLVTIGVPIYNHEKYIAQCLHSILEQSYKNIQIVAIDDGSSDSSFQMAKEILESQNRFEFIIKSRPNKGLCATLNEIIELSKGEFTSWIASDDWLHKDKTSRQVQYLVENPSDAMVHSNAYFVDDNSNLLGYEDISSKQTVGMIYVGLIKGGAKILTPTAMFRRSIFGEIGNYDTSLKFEDADFWLRLTKKHSVGFINEGLVYYRQHDKNMSRSENILIMMNKELIKIYEKNIDDKKLLRTALLKIYRKSFLRALRKFNVRYFFNNLLLYLKCLYGRDFN